MGPSSYIDPLYREKELTEDEILLRDEFVRMYFEHNHNAYEACLALGFMEVYATDWAKALMADGYVRRKIVAEQQKELTEEGINSRRNRYRSWMEKNATYYGPGSSHAARVAATAHLIKMEGMDAPIKTETEVTWKGGVMMVPALCSPDEWGNMAAQSQANLKQSVKD